MFRLEGGRPSDRRGFVHKSLIGKAIGTAVKTFVPAVGTAVNLVGTARGLVGGRGGGGRSFGRAAARPVAPRSTTARPSFSSSQGKEEGRQLKFGFGGPAPMSFVGGGGGGGFQPVGVAPPQRAPCDFPKVRDREGRCRTPTSGEFGGEQFGVGEAVMGRYGAALQPGSMIIDRAVCLQGMQLGDDGLCYNKANITNKQRMWPAGRKPLLSGGDMRAIGIAARAGRRLEGATKRLQRLGMMKKPTTTRRALPAHQHAKQIAAVSV